MARPRLEGLLYFTHDCNAHADEEKMIPLMARHGLEGYGHYFFLLEIIHSRKNGELVIDDIFLDSFTRQANILQEKFFEILLTEFKVGLFFSKNHKELFNNSRKLIDNSEKLINNSEKLGNNSGKPLVITSNGVKKRRTIVMGKRLKERDKKVSGGFSPGKTTQESDSKGGKGKEERERFKGKDYKEKEGQGKPPTAQVEKVAFEKAEKAWTSFESCVRNPPDSGIVIDDAISRKVFFDLGGFDEIKKLIAENGVVLRSVFCAKYAKLDIDNFQSKGV